MGGQPIMPAFGGERAGDVGRRSARQATGVCQVGRFWSLIPRGGASSWLRSFGRRGLSCAFPVLLLFAVFVLPADLAAQSQQQIWPQIVVTDSPEQLGVGMQIIVLLTLLTLLPAAVASLTPFLRIIVVLHFLRQALGTQTAPSNQTLLALSLFLTIVLMQPVADDIHAQAIVPLQQGDIGQWEALERAATPLRDHLARFVREDDLALFLKITHQPRPRNLDEVALTALMPAYVISELRVSFEIGAMLFLPFLIIDLMVASITLSLGMVQLPPIMISVPFKLLLFVLVDGWNLVVGSLVQGVQG